MSHCTSLPNLICEGINRMIGPEKQFSFSLAARHFWHLDINVLETEAYYIFDIQVDQHRHRDDDVQVTVLDQHNFQIWQIQQKAISAGANPVNLPKYESYTTGKFRWGCISFRPPVPGLYHLVIDNSHSSFTKKQVRVEAFQISSEWDARQEVRVAVLKAGWDEVWRLFTQAEEDVESNNRSNACDNLRKGLIILWHRVCEKLSKKNILFDPGKSPDIGKLKGTLGYYLPEHIVNHISHVWSTISELSHIEKYGGEDPSIRQVEYAIRLAYSSASILVSLLPKNE